jgi:GntR family transcriptional regulator, rspAB operon transcriptional repressor
VSSATGKATRDGGNVALVHERLRREILSGQIPAGASKAQLALAREMEVGRTPLREALRMLQHEGLVISEPNRRVRVADLSAVDAEQLYAMRISLEAMAVRVTVPELGTSQVAEIEGLLAQMNHYMRRQDSAGLRAPHRAFHACLVAGAGERTATTISLLFDHAERYRRAFGGRTKELWDSRMVEHRGIVDAATSGDPDLTVHRVVEHYLQTSALVFAGLDPDYDPRRLRLACASLAPGSEAALSA